MGQPWMAALGEKPNGAGCCLSREMFLLHPHPTPPWFTVAPGKVPMLQVFAVRSATRQPRVAGTCHGPRRLAKASTALTFEASDFGDASVRSYLTQATKRRRSSKEKASVLQVGCGEATKARGMQDTERRGWVASRHSSSGLACCKPGGRDIFFLASWFLMGAVGEDGKKQNRLQYRV